MKSATVVLILNIVILIYTYMSFHCTCQTQQKETSNNSLTFHCAYLSLFACTAWPHVSAHGAIIRRYINKSYTMNYAFYMDPYIVFSCVLRIK
jgi:hypothetical protein